MGTTVAWLVSLCFRQQVVQLLLPKFSRIVDVCLVEQLDRPTQMLDGVDLLAWARGDTPPRGRLVH